MAHSIGIIAEYNPFHNGHLHHLNESRILSGKEYSVCVLSGDFVQRGSPALFSKYARARAAVNAGVSLVLELPLPWCLSSAEGFARGSIALLKATGVVDSLSFGSEGGSIALLRQIASVLSSPEYENIMSSSAEKNASFAANREKAVSFLLGEDAASLLEKPNNNLAVEYIRAAGELKAGFDLYTVPRTGSEHGGAGSASALRDIFYTGGDILPLLPSATAEVLEEEIRCGRFVTPASLEVPILSRARMLTTEDFRDTPDVSEGLENLFCKASAEECTVRELLEHCKSKRYAMARLRRILLSSVLRVKKDMAKELPPYIRILAFDGKGRELLHEMRSCANLPIITKSSDARLLDKKASGCFALTAAAHDFWAIGCDCASERRGGEDYRYTPCYLK